MLPVSAIVFAIGIWLGDAAGVRAGPAFCAAVAAALLVGVALYRGRAVGVSALGLMLALGVLGQSARARGDPALFEGGRWTIDAEVESAPERVGDDGRTRLVVALRAVARDGVARAAAGRVSVSLGGDPVEPLWPGDHVRFTSALHRPRGFLNPGAGDPRRRAAARGIVATASVHRPETLVRFRDGAAAAWPERPLARLRARMDAAIARALPPGEGRGLVRALVIGDRGEIGRALDDAFRAAGVTHVLSVSGLHLAMAAFLFHAVLAWLLLRVPGLGRGWPVSRWAALLALPATVAYTILTGAQVATVRACVVAVIWLGGVVCLRRATASSALAMAALGILGVTPLALFDPSFQLSFAAALGLAVVAPRFSPSRAGGPVALRAALWAARLFVATAAAVVCTLPIALWHFAEVAPAGVVSNLVVVPLSEWWVMPAGLAGASLASAGVPGGEALLQLAGFGAELMCRFVRAFAAHAPVWRVAVPWLGELALGYVLLAALTFRPPRWRTLALACALLAAASVTVRLVHARASRTLTATFLDVGQGDACVLSLPGGHTVVVDGGGSFDPRFDPGRDLLVPFLHRRGVSRLAVIVLSHAHPDHANGLAALVEAFEVGEIWTSGVETEQPGTVRLLEAARARGVPVRRPYALTLGGVRFEPLGPRDGDLHLARDEAAGENDNSVILRLHHAGRRLLLAGDAEREAEARLVAAGELRADVLKVPHHGSRTSSTPAFVAAVRPTLAVASVGDRNLWGFPHPEVVARWERAGARLLRTDRDGAVTVHIDGAGRIAWETVVR